MNKEELKEFLKDNLKIKVETIPHDTGYCRPDSYGVKVSILLDNEVISESESDALN